MLTKRDNSRGQSCTILFHQCSDGTVHSAGVEALQGWQLKTLVPLRNTCVCTERYGVRPPRCVLTPENEGLRRYISAAWPACREFDFPACLGVLGRARGRAEFFRRAATRPAGCSHEFTRPGPGEFSSCCCMLLYSTSCFLKFLKFSP